MSTNSRKRSLANISDAQTLNEMNPAKKMKLNNKSNDKGMRTMFDDDKDHNECLGYFESIQSSKLPQMLQCPLDINRNIAEYAVGTIETCSNNECDAGICVLNEDWKYFEDIDDGIKFSKWNYCYNTEQYFCGLCVPMTTHFACCDTVQCVSKDNKNKCWVWKKGENDEEFMCYDDVNDTHCMECDTYFPFACTEDDCVKSWCADCVYDGNIGVTPRFICESCGRWICDECGMKKRYNKDCCGTCSKLTCPTCRDKGLANGCCEEKNK